MHQFPYLVSSLKCFDEGEPALHHLLGALGFENPAVHAIENMAVKRILLCSFQDKLLKVIVDDAFFCDYRCRSQS